MQLQLTSYLLSIIYYIIHLYIYIYLYDNPECKVFGVKSLDPGFSGDKSGTLEHDDQRAFISEKVEKDKR